MTYTGSTEEQKDKELDDKINTEVKKLNDRIDAISAPSPSTTASTPTNKLPKFQNMHKKVDDCFNNDFMDGPEVELQYKNNFTFLPDSVSKTRVNFSNGLLKQGFKIPLETNGTNTISAITVGGAFQKKVMDGNQKVSQ